MSNVSKIDNKVQGLWKHNTRDENFINELEQKYYRLLISNYGPHNKLTLIRNSASSDFVTSSSKTLLEQLSFFHPCFKFINAFINAQLKAYGVHGLYVGALCSSLLFRALKLENLICHRLVRDLCEWIQSSLTEKLHKEIHRMQLDIGKLYQILSLVKGVVFSKSYYDLTEQEKEHVSVKIVETFLKTLPAEGESKDFGKVVIFPLEGPSSLSSFTINGILHRDPDFSSADLASKLKRISREPLKMIVFTVPFSHDSKEKNLIEWHSQSSFEYLFVEHLRQLLKNVLKRKNVNVIANQMFIHAALKFDLEKDGFFVLERLGTMTTNKLVDMVGCCPVGNLSEIESIGDEHVGLLSGVEMTSIGEKIYLNIVPSEPHHSTTLVLTGVNSHAIEYLKESVETSISLLQMMMRDSSVTVGAGCFESVVAHILSQMKEDSVPHLAEIFDASPIEANMVFDEFIETFLHLSIVPTGGNSKKLVDYFVDSVFHHLWESSNGLETEGNYHQSKLTETNCKPLFPAVHFHCACGSITQSELSSTANFTCLQSLKKGKSFDLRNESNTNVDSLPQTVSDPSLEFRKNCIVDYLPAKLNAVQFALDGFCELYKIGFCIFDK